MFALSKYSEAASGNRIQADSRKKMEAKSLENLKLIAQFKLNSVDLVNGQTLLKNSIDGQ